MATLLITVKDGRSYLLCYGSVGALLAKETQSQG